MTTITTGTRLGPYEIVSRIGAGGMGEVWKARDTRLDRSVAIKILPAEFAHDEQLRSRFEREAKTISQLEHPHICRLYDVGLSGAPAASPAHGISDAGEAAGVPLNYLVMELLDCETLADRVARGPLPLGDVLKYGAQIAEALDRAHRAGVVHRDLKPGNIMITKSGAKLLDFGLAKSQASVDLDGATVQKPLTREGTIVGTFQYMAPEQLEGKEADARTDIFGLGAVLYEMATGRRTFEGGTKTSLIASILRDTPRPISELQPLAPNALEHVVFKCLEKEPDDRWQSAHDVAQELRWIEETISRPSGTAAQVSTPRRRWGWAAVALLVLVAAAIALVRTRTAQQPSIRRFDLQPPDGVEVLESNAPSILGISPDGEWIAFRGGSDDASRNGLYVRSIREIDARRLVASSAGGTTPFFSPDSKWVGVQSEGALQKVPLTGGEPQTICPAARLRGASWGDDDSILFSTGDGLLRVPAEGGSPETITTPRHGERHYWPHLLPGSQAALFTIHRGGGDAFRTIAVITLADRKVHELVPGTAPQFVDGHLVYGNLGNVYAVRFDPKRLRIAGKPRLVLRDVYYYWGSGASGFAVAPSGALVYMPGTPRTAESDLVWLDGDGKATQAISEKRPFLRIALSPDGSRIVARIATGVEESDLWLYEIQGGRWTRLTYGKRVDSPLWSPDGQWIYFGSGESGQPDIWRVRADGAGAPEAVVASPDWEYPRGITQDGKTLLFMRQLAPSQWDLLTCPIEGNRVETPFLASDVLESWPDLSPDGRWVAYESDETGGREVHVRPFPGPGPKVTVSTAGGRLPVWSRDGRWLYYRRGSGEIWAVSVSTGGGRFVAGQPRLRTTVPWLLPDWNSTVTAAGDGDRLLAIRLPPEAQRMRRLVYVPNWIAEVRAIQP